MKEAACAAAHHRKAAAQHTGPPLRPQGCLRTACGGGLRPALTPETTAAPGGRNQGPGTRPAPALARQPRPGWPPAIVNEESVNLPALLRRLLEPADCMIGERANHAESAGTRSRGHLSLRCVIGPCLKRRAHSRRYAPAMRPVAFTRRGRRSGRSARWGRRLAWREAWRCERQGGQLCPVDLHRAGRGRDLLAAVPDRSIDAAWLPGPLEAG